MAAAGPLFDQLSLRGLHIPSAASLKATIEDRKIMGKHVGYNEFPDDRHVTLLGFMKKTWLKRVARKLIAEFPGGFPSDHNIYASLMKIPAGAAEQEVHADGDDGEGNAGARFWTLFIPLTNHRMQGTTAFVVNGRIVLPPRGCSNYMFDSTVLHYGQANRSNRDRYVLMLNVGSKDSFWQHFDTPVSV
jgi:hypothetical protein